MLGRVWVVGGSNFLLYLMVNLYSILNQDAMDELNGRAYDGRDLRIRLDEGRPR